jgi:hypothetical protein
MTTPPLDPEAIRKHEYSSFRFCSPFRTRKRGRWNGGDYHHCGINLGLV